ncbi:MAG: hypothetical protein M3R70_08885 [Actinomycetota bacterium]|nr:hypothetical protein [Actinomycetota bacterium]
MWIRAAAIVTATLLAAGCGGKKPAKKASSDCGSFGGSTAVQTGGKPSDTMLLTDVQPKVKRCADTVTFRFRPDRAEEPGYKAEYQPATQAKVQDGSGAIIPVAGTAFLVIRLEPSATADLTGEVLEITYRGPRRFKPAGMRHVQEIVKTSDFEGVVAWVIGLDEQRPFKVSPSTSPSLAVEIG